MEKRDKKMPYEVVIQERKRVDLYGNVVYYIHWFDKYGYNITKEWKFWSKGPKKKYQGMKTIKVDKVILYYMDRVDPDGNPYRFYVYKGMASEIEYFCTEEAGNMTQYLQIETMRDGSLEERTGIAVERIMAL